MVRYSISWYRGNLTDEQMYQKISDTLTVLEADVSALSSKIYGKLAITNLKNNRKTYVPYILMAVLSVMMYYIVGGMAQGNNGLSKNVKMIMGYMNGLLMIFSVIFLFYTNSFLIKRRKREIGIYNILGMGKGHIAKMPCD